MRYRSDWIALAVIAICLGAATSVALGFLGLGGLLMVPMWRWLGLIQHNHVHLGLSRSRQVNLALSAILTCLTGVPSQLYFVHHVAVHHANLDPVMDWTSPYSHSWATYPVKPLPIGLYIPLFIARGWIRASAVLWNRFPALRSKLAYELVGLGCYWGLIFLVASSFTVLLLLVLPVAATYIGLPLNNARHHRERDLLAADPLMSSNTKLGILHTTLGFNIGYHAAHHHRPAAHWTKLIHVHEQLLDSTDRKAMVR